MMTIDELTDQMTIHLNQAYQLAYAAEASNCELRVKIRTEIRNYLFDRTEIKVRNYLIMKLEFELKLLLN